MVQYSWRKGMPAPKVSADVFGRVYERIVDEKGIAKAEDIVAEAAKPKSPIRDALTWDDTAAANAHRIDQARRLLAGLTIVRVEVEERPTISNRAAHNVRMRDGERGYAPHSAIMSDRNLKKQVIGTAARELKGFVSRYESILAMGKFNERLQGVIDEMLDEVERLEVEATARRSGRAAGDTAREEARV